MKIKHYSYNSFTIEDNGMKLAIDPGQNLYMFRKKSLIPDSEWKSITHILLTHGDPDHFVYAIPMAKASGAVVVCGEALKEDFIVENINSCYPLKVNENLDFNSLQIEGLNAKHGSLPVRMLGGLFFVKGEVKQAEKGGQEVYFGGIRLQKIEKPLKVFSHGTVKIFFGLLRLEKDNIDFARGSIGFRITMENKTLINLGDSLLLDEWTGLKPDVLMIPIGGGKIPNTMDVQAALRAVKLISPRMVIPCHYNVPYGLKRNANPTDGAFFKIETEKLGIRCELMEYGQEIVA